MGQPRRRARSSQRARRSGKSARGSFLRCSPSPAPPGHAGRWTPGTADREARLGWKLELGVRDGAEGGGPARRRPPHFRRPLRAPRQPKPGPPSPSRRCGTPKVALAPAPSGPGAHVRSPRVRKGRAPGGHCEPRDDRGECAGGLP